MIAYHDNLIDQLTAAARVQLLADLIAWADTGEGVEVRAALAAEGATVNPVTAQDVIAVLDARATNLVADALPELDLAAEPLGVDAMPDEWSEEDKNAVCYEIDEIVADLSGRERIWCYTQGWSAKDWEDFRKDLFEGDEEEADEE